MSVTLETLHFDNYTLNRLPLDKVKQNYIRQVPNACFSRVNPTPVDNPRLVAVSKSALALVDINESDIERPEFVEYFSGNKIIPGSEPAAHCYCGHQFGSFAGQLGDGAAMYLGEIINKFGQRWEIQLKGAGPTPYSRSADGRKVLRSSIREFLCSEANYYLGIPTTRAGCVITSDSRVERDVLYSGNPIMERCSIVLRMASTFIRFGSFEIFKDTDAMTGAKGPSSRNYTLQKQMMDHIVDTFYSELVNGTQGVNRYSEVYREIVRRTARLVASWQSFGWCHGVLNTDNMHILGLTIDYGPFGYMETYDPDYVCNGSDHDGRYRYEAQPEICKWNLLKLAEAWQPTLPLEVSKPILDSEYDNEYTSSYNNRMRQKLGLTTYTQEDTKLLESLLEIMKSTGSDWTHTFRNLRLVAQGKDLSDVWDMLSTYQASPSILSKTYMSKAKMCRPNIPEYQLAMLRQMARTNKEMLAQMVRGPVDMVIEELEKEQQKIVKRDEYIKKAKACEQSSSCELSKVSRKIWLDWLEKYKLRLASEPSLEESVKIMNNANPAFVLRNWICQKVIEQAEEGDYSGVQNLVEILQTPFDDLPDDSPWSKPSPEWHADLCVTCSS